jgi:hypothetical protein
MFERTMRAKALAPFAVLAVLSTGAASGPLLPEPDDPPPDLPERLFCAFGTFDNCLPSGTGTGGVGRHPGMSGGTGSGGGTGAGSPGAAFGANPASGAGLAVSGGPAFRAGPASTAAPQSGASGRGGSGGVGLDDGHEEAGLGWDPTPDRSRAGTAPAAIANIDNILDLDTLWNPPSDRPPETSSRAAGEDGSGAGSGYGDAPNPGAAGLLGGLGIAVDPMPPHRRSSP